MTRQFTGGGSGGKKGSKTTTTTTTGDEDEDNNDEDFFGVSFEDGSDPGKLGPEENLPPKYKRDAATGRFTGDVEMEVSEEQRRMIESDEFQRSKILMRRMESHWKKANTDADGDETTRGRELNALGKRIREGNMGMNVLGRSVEAQAATERADDGSETGRDEHGFTQRLSKQEFESFRAYMKKRYKVEVSEDEMPVLLETAAMNRTDSSSSSDDIRLATKWMTAQAQRQMDESLDDNPYADLMPADLSPSRLVNRKKAKPIPVQLLHHNNIPLLQSFMTVTAQIKSRVQSRLGARDQRRVSRLIKRARCLGLMPYQGQFRSEQHGWVHAKDIEKKRPWEKELERRGLVIKKHKENKNTTQGGEAA